MTRRVAVLFEYSTVHGGERSFLSVVPFLRTAGFEPVALGPAEGDLARALHQAGVPLEPVDLSSGVSGPRSPGPRGATDLETRRERLERAIRAVRPALVHANSLSMSRLLGPVARRLGVLSIGHLRDIIRLSAAALRDVGLVDRLVAVSEATRSAHVAAGLGPAPVAVVYNGVDTEAFTPGRRDPSLRSELGVPEDGVLIVSVGQLVARKGVDMALEAFARVAASARSPVRFALAGERFSGKAEAVAYEEDLRARAERPPLEGRCRFLGFHHDMPRLLASADVLVHAARQEPLGRVLLEAAASELAIVATDAGGTSEIFPPVGDGGSESARVVPVGDVDRMARELEVLVTDASMRSRVGRAARQRVRRDFTVETAARGLVEVYRGVLDSSVSGRGGDA